MRNINKKHKKISKRCVTYPQTIVTMINLPEKLVANRCKNRSFSYIKS